LPAPTNLIVGSIVHGHYVLALKVAVGSDGYMRYGEGGAYTEKPPGLNEIRRKWTQLEVATDISVGRG